MAPIDAARRQRGWYQRIWRWHFYAGIVTLPFVILLSITGMIFLFKPQIDAWQERSFDHLSLASPPHTLDDQVAAARAALPDARLTALEWRPDPTDAARVLMMTPDGKTLRVYVRPDSLSILGVQPEKSRVSNIVRTLHGELFAGEAGAILVETVGGWAIVMVITGLYLWWPRGAAGAAGVLYPRWGGGRRWLRDLHAVTGFWISLLALFFLISALPWTKVWGGGLKRLEAALGSAVSQQDWTTGPASEHANHLRAFSQSMPAAHEAMTGMAGVPETALGFDEIARHIPPLALADPVRLLPPTQRQPNWLVRSDAQNRPLRTTVELDRQSGNIVHQRRFADGPLFDRIVGIGVAAHEGQLFGWLNQLLGVLTAVGLLTMSASAALMWWRRRPRHHLGAPAAPADPPRLAPLLGMAIIVLAAILPTLGMSLILVLLFERLALRRMPRIADWLGVGS